MDSGLELVKYRDAGMSTYTFFWIVNKKLVSPYFDSEKDANIWLEAQKDNLK